MATIKDVARLANVSIATVSRVINHSPKAGEAALDMKRLPGIRSLVLRDAIGVLAGVSGLPRVDRGPGTADA